MPVSTNREAQQKVKETLTEMQRQKYINEKLAGWQADRAKDQQQAADDLQKDSMTRGPRGEEISKWDYAMQLAENAVNSEQTTFNDWRNAMMNILNMASHLLDALVIERKQLTSSICNTFTNILGIPIDQLRLKMSTEPEFFLPTLKQAVSFDNENKLTLKPLESSDGLDMNGKFDALYKKGVNMWLEENGYKPSPQDGSKYYNEDGVQLTKETFNTLKDNPNNGLDAFLSREHEVTYTSSMQP